MSDVIIYRDNPRIREQSLQEVDLRALSAESVGSFSKLPVFHQGQSSELRKTHQPGVLIQKLLPSLNSITHGRKGVVDGTSLLRAKISELFWTALHREGLSSCHLARLGEYVLVSEESVPPIEVIVKAAMVGTPARIYDGILGRRDRFGELVEEGAAHAPYVRFDYRNPLESAEGARLRDECLPLALAERFIDTTQAADYALRLFSLLQARLATCGLEVLDACFLFDETGKVLTYEISPDNMRIKRRGWREAEAGHDLGGHDFDKDLWRKGSGGAEILEKWTSLYEILKEQA